ncbi:MAG: tetratricopeptide repeat protein, partial [Candidatus Krumholzibacteria bacterium]|nr:tetratricopeptide repeat protein [Candidatus Krumholzibacteria bacterium]
GATLSKVNAIRKKALECVRRQDWQNAVKEYNRLADLDQSNPNVFNELGDIHLKTGSKTEAYKSFSRAIDSYTRVSLHNNAVAVCKKVLRLIPSRYEVLTKLGLIRKKQGLMKEAESYYLSYFEKLLIDDQIGPTDVKKNCDEIVEEMGDSVIVLEKTYDSLVKFNLKGEAAGVLYKLYTTYRAENSQADLERTRQRLMEIGEVPPQSTEPSDVGGQKNGAVITEDNIWSAAHTEGERIEVHQTTESADQTPIAASDADSVFSYGDLQIGAKGRQPQTGDGAPQLGDATAGGTDTTATQTVPPPEPSPAPDAPTEKGETVEQAADQAADEVYDITPDGDEVAAPETAEPKAAEPKAAVPKAPVPEQMPTAQPTGDATPQQSQTQSTSDSPSSGIAGSPDDVHVSAIIDELNADGGGELSDDDYRSHYDLGMAYMEMDLLPEAIREYQFAARSPKYQARALEMIGLCFLNQNQATLAIKQLTKGLEVIGDHESEALGMKYNLGLAYEMAGDFERAKGAFEDVYVEDVTFREVAEKIQKYS